MDAEKDKKLKKYIYGTFLNDAIGYIMIAILACLSYSYNFALTPLIIIFTAWLLFQFIRLRRLSNLLRTDSYRITYTMARGTLVAALIGVVLTLAFLMIIRMINADFLYYKMLLYFIMLYVMPALLLISNWQNKNPNKSIFNIYSTLKYGHIIERSYLGKFIFMNDLKVIKNIFRATSLLVFLIWGYYLFVFINWNINSQDRIIFTLIPLVVAIVGIIDIGMIVGSKYIALKRVLDGNEMNNSLHKVDNLCVRAMLFCGNKMYIKINGGHYDQALHVDKSVKNADNDVDLYLTNLFGLKDIMYSVRLYDNEDIIIGSKVERYVIFVESEDMVEPIDNCEWVEVDELPYCGTMSEYFKFEWLRVLTFITVKDLYNTDGTFKDKNKRYTEEIRLMDIVDKNIDFNDVETMKLSIFNANRSLYRLKKIWFRDVEGIID